MKPVCVRYALLVVMLLPAAAGPARAEVPLNDATQDKLRDRTAGALKASRADPAKAQFSKELDQFIVVEPNKTVYEHDKAAQIKLTRERKSARELDGEERAKSVKMLRTFHNCALFEHDKGLLDAAEAKKLDPVAHLDVAPRASEEERADAPQTSVKDLNQEKVRGWVAAVIEDMRKQPDWVATWNEVDDLLVIDHEKIVYEHDEGVPVKLAWQIRLQRKLTADERAKVQEKMRKLAQHILFEHNKGLVAVANADMLKKPVQVDIAADPVAAVDDKTAEEIERLRKEIDQLRKDDADARAKLEARIELARKQNVDVRVKIEAETEELRKRPAGEGRIDVEQIRKGIVAYPAEIDARRQELASAQGDGGVRSPSSPAAPVERGRYVMMLQPSSMIYYDFCSRSWLPGPASVVYYPAGRTESAPPGPVYAPLPAGAALPPPEQAAPVLGTTVGADADASHAFWVGYRSYWHGDYDRALASFDAALCIDDQDARFWYYKALAERALGDAARAEASARRGRELHAAHKPRADLVGAALERVQGQERRFLNTPEVIVSEAGQDR